MPTKTQAHKIVTHPTLPLIPMNIRHILFADGYLAAAVRLMPCGILLDQHHIHRRWQGKFLVNLCGV